MTTRKSNGVVTADEWTLNLPSQHELVNESNQAYRSAVSRHRVLSKGEERVSAEGNKQLLVVEYEAQKAYMATQENAKVHELATESFYDLAVHHDENIQQTAGKEIQKPVRQYAMYDLDTMGRQQQKISEVLIQKLIEIQVRDVYVNDEPEIVVVEKERPPRNIIERIFGGTE